jgi:hypothetical protein
MGHSFIKGYYLKKGWVATVQRSGDEARFINAPTRFL